jgi:hypothetical protein
MHGAPLSFDLKALKARFADILGHELLPALRIGPEVGELLILICPTERLQIDLERVVEKAVLRPDGQIKLEAGAIGRFAYLP